MIQPYKGEILPHWRFRTPAIARASSDAIMQLFRRYQRSGDFVGMDMARKFLQMGYTRARRYANYAGGRKYDPSGAIRPRANDATKAAAARVFYERWREVAADPDYQRRRREHIAKFG